MNQNSAVNGTAKAASVPKSTDCRVGLIAELRAQLLHAPEVLAAAFEHSEGATRSCKECGTEFAVNRDDAERYEREAEHPEWFCSGCGGEGLE